MSPLQWQESPPRPSGILGFIVGVMSAPAFSFLLMGLIAGYILGTVLR